MQYDKLEIMCIYILRYILYYKYYFIFYVINILNIFKILFLFLFTILLLFYPILSKKIIYYFKYIKLLNKEFYILKKLYNTEEI